MIKAVLFDMDGVLVNTETFYIQALIETLFEETGVKLKEEEVERYAGLIYVEKLKRIFREKDIKGDPYEIAEKSRKRFLRIIKGKIRLLPGAKDLIDQLSSSGIRLGLVSSSKRMVVDIVLKQAKLQGIFDVIVTQDDVKNLKPHPEPYLLASKILGIRPEECVAVEDSVHGILSAKSAGMKCIAIANPYIPISKYSKADLIVKGLEEIKLETILGLNTK